MSRFAKSAAFKGLFVIPAGGTAGTSSLWGVQKAGAKRLRLLCVCKKMQNAFCGAGEQRLPDIMHHGLQRRQFQPLRDIMKLRTYQTADKRHINRMRVQPAHMIGQHGQQWVPLFLFAAEKRALHRLMGALRKLVLMGELSPRITPTKSELTSTLLLPSVCSAGSETRLVSSPTGISSEESLSSMSRRLSPA